MTVIYYPYHNILSLLVPGDIHDIGFIAVAGVWSSA
jgi:hypothetical protein